MFAVLLPVSAFVVAGFEHSVANMYSIPLAIVAGIVETDIPSLLRNLLFVTVGNVAGGGVLVALAYWSSTSVMANSRGLCDIRAC
jgi:formate/nitrite transporter FocA (FNT family)